MKLTIVAGDVDGATTVVLSGEFDLATAGELEAEVERLVAAGSATIVADLHELTFCDSVGLNALIRARSHCDAAGGWLRVTRPRGEVAHVMHISGLFEHLAPDEV